MVQWTPILFDDAKTVVDSLLSFLSHFICDRLFNKRMRKKERERKSLISSTVWLTHPSIPFCDGQLNTIILCIVFFIPFYLLLLLFHSKHISGISLKVCSMRHVVKHTYTRKKNYYFIYIINISRATVCLMHILSLHAPRCSLCTKLFGVARSIRNSTSQNRFERNKHTMNSGGKSLCIEHDQKSIFQLVCAHYLKWFPDKHCCSTTSHWMHYYKSSNIFQNIYVIYLFFKWFFFLLFDFKIALNKRRNSFPDYYQREAIVPIEKEKVIAYSFNLENI